MKRFKDLEDVSDNFRGLLIRNRKQYWFYGNGYFRKWKENTVYHKDGKRLGNLFNKKIKNELKKLTKIEEETK